MQEASEVIRLEAEAFSERAMMEVQAFAEQRVPPGFPAFVRDIHGHVRWMNRAFQEAVGLEKPVPCDLTCLNDDIFEALSVRAASQTMLFEPTPGDVKAIKGSLQPILSSAGEFWGVLAVGIDVSDWLLESEKRRQDVERVQQENMQKNHCIAHMSHDLRTPIAGIISMADLLAREQLSARGEEALGHLKASAEVLQQLMHDMIEMMKLDAGHGAGSTRAFSVKELASQVYLLFSPQAREKQLLLQVTCDERIPHLLEGDERRFQRVLLNLVNNAIKFTQVGEVDVRLQCAKETEAGAVIQMQVRDTGLGIPQEKQALVFSRFTRIKDQLEKRASGTGLGLSIVKQFVKDLHGEIYLESREGIGSVFTCLVPLKKVAIDSMDQPSQPALSEVATTTLLKHVLLVEDNVISQCASRAQFEGEGWQVDVVSDGQALMRQLGRGDYDLILLDRQLPDVQGEALCKQIKQWYHQSGQRLPWLVVLSAHSIDELDALGLGAVFDRLMSKPLTRSSIELLEQDLIKRGGHRMTHEEVLDLRHGAAMMSGNEELARKMYHLFGQSIQPHLEALSTYVKQEDWHAARSELHAFRGAMAYCGLRQLPEKALALHDALKQEELPPISQAFQALHQEALKVLEAIEALGDSEATD